MHALVLPARPGTLTGPMRLDAAGPFDPDATLAFLASRVIAGVEEVDAVAKTYRRDAVVVRFDAGGVTVGPATDAATCARIRRLLALDADPRPGTAVLAEDPVLAVLVAARPGLRVPGAWDPFELAVRAVVGQQVTVAAARTLLGRVIARCGTPGRFPTADELLDADLDGLGMPGSRAATLHAVAAAMIERRIDDGDCASWQSIAGIGPWTASYIAMRLGDGDAFPAADAGLRQAAARLGLPTAQRQLTAHAERWRPHRALATVHLWTSLAAPNADPVTPEPA